VKPISFLHPSLIIGNTKGKGRGVFSKTDLQADLLLERSPVIVMSGADRKLLDQTLLHDYIFEWGDKRDKCCMAMGYVPLYNHSFFSNCEYTMDFRKKMISIKTVRAITAGEELFINYNGDWNNDSPIWFTVK